MPTGWKKEVHTEKYIENKWFEKIVHSQENAFSQWFLQATLASNTMRLFDGWFLW